MDKIAELKNEDKLLLYCCRPIDSKIESEIKLLVHKDLDWVYLFKKTFDNNLLLILYQQLNSICQNDIPKYFIEALNENYIKTVNSNQLIMDEILTVFQLLQSHDILAILFEGPFLTFNNCRDYELQVINEINVFIEHNDALKAKKLLLSNNYKSNPSLNLKNKDSLYSVVKNDFIVNICWKFHEFSFYLPLNPLLIMDTLEINGITTVSKENLIILLCLKFIEKYFRPLSIIYDIGELISKCDLDWSKIIRDSEKLNIERIIYVVLFLTSHLLDVNLPSAISGKINRDNKVNEISIKILNNVFSYEIFFYGNNSQSRFEKLIIHFKIRNNRFYGVMDCFIAIMAALKYDKNFIYLPSFLYPFYNLIGQFRSIFYHNLSSNKINICTTYHPTPSKIIEKMLEIGNIEKNDIIYDLGSGDGRVIITAAKKYGVFGVGIDIDPEKIRESKINAKKEGVEHLTEFIEEDINKIDLSKATIIIMSLFPADIQKILPNIKKLPSNTRIITNEVGLADWEPLKEYWEPIRVEKVVDDGNIYPLLLRKP